MAKRIRVSDDSGTTWYTLPGTQGEISFEGGSINDTIFGQDYSSMQSGLVNWSMKANAYFKGFAGYVATLKKTAAVSTTMTAEACSLVSGKTYQITAAAKRIIDRSAAITVKGNGVAIAASNILNIDYLFGQVTFIAAYTPTLPITIDGKYFTTSVLARGKTFTLTQTVDTNDESDFETVQANSGLKTFSYGLRTVNLEIGGIYSAANDYQGLVAGRGEWIIDINPDGQSKSIARGFFKALTEGSSGNVGALEQETIKFALSVPDDALLYRPFSWAHNSTTLSTAVQKCLTAWANGSTVWAQYLPDGTTGKQGTALVTEISLSGGLEAMNEFSVVLQGTGALTTV